MNLEKFPGIKYYKPTLGSDPEFFIYIKDKELGHKIIPADKILKGKNEKENATHGFAFFDGVQAEINPDFNNCREYVLGNIHDCLEYTYKKSCKKLKTKDVIFAPIASVDMTQEDLKGCDDECFRFGCSPDYNIYEDLKIDYPDGSKFMTRFSGGHIHLGLTNISHKKYFDDPDKMYNLVRAFDLLPGIMSVCLSKGREERIRRNWYGQAGTYRIQKHGIEYRSLSSFWLASPQLASLMFGLVRDSFSLVYDKNTNELDILDSVSIDELKNTINNIDGRKATELYFDIIKPLYKKTRQGNINIPLSSKKVRDTVEFMIENDYQSIFNPYSMLNYWGIAGKNKIPFDIIDSGILNFSHHYKQEEYDAMNKWEG